MGLTLAPLPRTSDVENRVIMNSERLRFIDYWFEAAKSSNGVVRMSLRTLFVGFVLVFLSAGALADDYSYDKVKKRYTSTALSATEVQYAKMQGECLVGLKDLNFKKKNNFDPVAEWGNYRSLSLLEQFSPCEVLIMMEVAQSKLKSRHEQK